MARLRSILLVRRRLHCCLVELLSKPLDLDRQLALLLFETEHTRLHVRILALERLNRVFQVLRLLCARLLLLSELLYFLIQVCLYLR